MFVFLLITVYYKTVYLSGTGLPRSSWKKRPLNGCGVVVLQDSCPLHCRFLKPDSSLNNACWNSAFVLYRVWPTVDLTGEFEKKVTMKHYTGTSMEPTPVTFCKLLSHK